MRAAETVDGLAAVAHRDKPAGADEFAQGGVVQRGQVLGFVDKDEGIAREGTVEEGRQEDLVVEVELALHPLAQGLERGLDN